MSIWSLPRTVVAAIAWMAFSAVVGAQAPTPAGATLTQTLGPLGGAGCAIAYSEAAGLLAIGCEDGTIRLWPKDLLLGVRAGRDWPLVLSGHAAPVTALAWEGDVLASAGADQKIIVWKVAEQQPAQTLSADGIVRALALTRDGKLLASAGDDPAIQLWAPAEGKRLGKLEGHTDWVVALAFAPEGKRLASGGYDGSVRLWNVETGKPVVGLPMRPPGRGLSAEPGPAILSVAFSPDGGLVAAGANDAKVHVFSAADGKLGRTLHGHGSSVTAVAFSPRDGMLAAAGRDNTVRLWASGNGQAIKTLEGHQGWVQGLLFFAHGTHVASVGADHTARIWHVSSP
jgi:WD40 repeat protein